MAADGAQHPGQLRRRCLPKSRQAQDHFADPRRAQRSDGDSFEIRFGSRNGIPAGEQEPPRARGAGKLHQALRHIRVQKRAAAQVEVLLEIIEYENHPLGFEGLCQEFEANPIVEAGLEQHVGHSTLGAAGLCEGHANLHRAFSQVEAPDAGGDQPPLLRETLHGSAGKGALAGAADARQHSARILPLGVTERAQQQAQLFAAPDQVVHLELGHRTGEFVNR